MTGTRSLRMLVPTVIPVAVIFAWWVSSAQSTSPFYPPLSEVLVAFQNTWLFSRVMSDVVPSMTRLLLGFGIAVILGIAIGVLFGRSRVLGRAFNPSVQFGRALPGAALVPVSVLIFGIGDFAKIVVIAFLAFFPVLLNTIDAVRSIDPQLEDVCRVFRLSRFQRLWSVFLPAAGPQVFAGMRVSLQLAFIMMVVTELFAATNGIGYVTLQAKQTFDMTGMWAGMILLGLLGVATNVVFVGVQRRVLRWHIGMTEGT